MELHPLAMPLAYIGAVLGVAMVLPQLTRTVRNPELTGVSSASWALTSIACMTWLVYGLRADVLPQVPGNVFLVAGAVAVVLLVPSAWSRSHRAASLAGVGAAVIVVSMLITPQMVGYLAFAISIMSVWPQLVDSFGNWRTSAESGISLSTWSVKIAAAICWLSYATLSRDVPVLIASLMGLSTALAVLGMEASARQAVVRREAVELAEA